MLVDEGPDVKSREEAAHQGCHRPQLHHVGLHDLGGVGVLHLDRDRGAISPGAAMHLTEARGGDGLGVDVDALGQSLELLLDRLQGLRLGVFVEPRESGELGGLVRRQGRGEDRKGLAELQGWAACLGQCRGQGLDGGRRGLGVDRVAIGAECRGRGSTGQAGTRGDGDRGE